MASLLPTSEEAGALEDNCIANVTSHFEENDEDDIQFAIVLQNSVTDASGDPNIVAATEASIQYMAKSPKVGSITSKPLILFSPTIHVTSPKQTPPTKKQVTRTF